MKDKLFRFAFWFGAEFILDWAWSRYMHFAGINEAVPAATFVSGGYIGL